MPKLYAIASAKGGVGKTTTAANLAATLAAAGYDTVAVDGDLGGANLAAALGVDVDDDDPTLHDVLAGKADPAAATYEGPHGLAVVPGSSSLDAFRKADPSRLKEVLTAITSAEYVVVDTAAGLSHESALPLSLADGVLLVSTPTRDALTDTAKTRDLTDRLGGTVAGVALTHADSDADAGSLDVPVLGTIPEDDAVAEAIDAGEPLATYAPGSDAAAAYRSLASSLTGEPIRPPLAEVDDSTTAADVAVDVPADEDRAEAPEAEAEAESESVAESEAEAEAESESVAESEAEAEAESESVAESEAEAEAESESVAESEAEAEAESESVAESEAEAEAESESVAESEAEAGSEPAASEPSPELDEDDAVIIDDEAEEDDAGAAARTTVLGEEEFAAVRDDAVTVEDAESGESAELGDDVIPFAEQSRDRAEAATGDEEEDEGDDDSGGFLGRLFR
ncbi:P-loop NTPase [Halobaculum sp. P14]|uniref:nucleotide-binding protein n=1 Tax=Halobaculum sp. P14 TaxID=3421638 RepID=UPI003EB9228A